VILHGSFGTICSRTVIPIDRGKQWDAGKADSQTQMLYACQIPKTTPRYSLLYSITLALRLTKISHEPSTVPQTLARNSSFGMGSGLGTPYVGSWVEIWGFGWFEQVVGRFVTLAWKVQDAGDEVKRWPLGSSLGRLRLGSTCRINAACTLGWKCDCVAGFKMSKERGDGFWLKGAHPGDEAKQRTWGS
jgi:hypothetical protein